jgi:hypothetical protein
LYRGAQYFALLGWGNSEDGISDDRLTALLRRVNAYKTAYEKFRDQQVGAICDVMCGVVWCGV